MNKTCTINNLSIHYRISEFQSERYIIFLHGNSSNLNSFESLFELQNFFKANLIFIDLPGHGLSGKLQNYSLENIANLVQSFLEKIIPAGSEVALVGHSLGGHVAINVLGNSPIKNLIIFGTPPLLEKNARHGFKENSLAVPLLSESASLDEIRLLFKEFNFSSEKISYFENVFLQADPKLRSDLCCSLIAGEFKNEINILSNSQSHIGLLKCINDDFIDNNYIDEVTKNLKVKVISLNLGHVPQVENPTLFITAIYELLNN